MVGRIGFLPERNMTNWIAYKGDYVIDFRTGIMNVLRERIYYPDGYIIRGLARKK